MDLEERAKWVAIVDDDELLREAVSGVLKEAGVAARAFGSAEEFLESGDQHRSACLIADIRMPDLAHKRRLAREVLALARK